MHDTSGEGNWSAPVIEWAPFRLADGVSEEALLAASRALQEDFLDRQDGFVRRDLLRASAAEWVDLVHWRDARSAQAAMAAAAESPICHQYFHLMDGENGADPGSGVLHLAQVCTYLAAAHVDG